MAGRFDMDFNQPVFEVFIPSAAPESASSTVVRQLSGCRIQTVMLARGQVICAYVRHSAEDALSYARGLMAWEKLAESRR